MGLPGSRQGGLPFPFTISDKESHMTATTQETVVTEEHSRLADVPDVITVRGIADISDGRGHLVAGGYRRSPADIPLPAALIRQYGLRRGDEVEGLAIRPATRPATRRGAAQGNGSPGNTARGSD